MDSKNQIKALIRLIEDNEPTVVSAVDAKIIAMGSSILPDLKLYYSGLSSEPIKKRVLTLALNSLKNELFNTFVNLKTNKYNNWGTFSYIIAKIIDPFLELTAFEKIFNELIGFNNALNNKPLNYIRHFSNYKFLFFDFYSFNVLNNSKSHYFSPYELLMYGNGNLDAVRLVYFSLNQLYNENIKSLDSNSFSYLAYVDRNNILFYIDIRDGQLISKSDFSKILLNEKVSKIYLFSEIVDFEVLIVQILKRFYHQLEIENDKTRLNIVDNLIGLTDISL